MNLNNVDLPLLGEPCPLLYEIPNLESIDLVLTYQDIATLNDLISRINLDINTQNLRVEVEKIKRQKLRMTMRNLKNDINSPTRL